MPINQELLEILCCPRSKVPVEMMGPAQVAHLNREIAAGTLRYADGTAVEDPVEEGLVTTDGITVYRIDDSIPVMLVDKAIPTAQVPGW